MRYDINAKDEHQWNHTADIPKKTRERFNMASEARNYRLSGEMLTISIEQERDSYREKLEHMKILLRRYEQELESHKVRKEGVETVSKLLQEARQEHVGLQRKNKKMESAVINLQNRLTTHGLSSSIATDEGELLVPGLSKQYLDNLASENLRLRSLIRASSRDPEDQDVERRRQNEKDFLVELEDLRSERDEALNRAREFDTYLKSTDNDKDTQISFLGEQIQQIERDYHAREVLCQSLTEESTKLRQQLKDVAIRCQQMAIRLEDGQSESRTVNTKERDSDRLVKENHCLRDKITEIAEMNRRWQEYNNQREKYVQHLKTINDDQKSALMIHASRVTTENEQQLVGTIQIFQQQVRQLEDEKNNMQRELHQTHQELVKLNEEKQALHTPTGMSVIMDTDADRIEALKAQIQLCTEDFASERRDRENAQSRIIEVEAEVEQLRRERDSLLASRTVPVCQDLMFRPGEQPNYTRNYINIPSSYQPENNLAARGVHIDDLNVKDSKTVLLERDSPPEERFSEKDNHQEDDRSDSFPSLQTCPSLTEYDSTEKQVQTLKCPQCHKEYTSDRHGELLEHIELCCD